MDKKTPYKFPDRKTRSIEAISEHYQAARAIAVQLQETRRKLWYDEGEKLKTFWGYDRKEGIHKRIKVVFNFSDHGHSRSCIYSLDHKQLAQVADPKNLPLMLNDPKYEKSRDYIVAILKGDLPSAVKRQDLVDENCYLEERFKNIHRVEYSYLNMLKFYVREKFRDRIYDRFNSGFFLIVTVGKYIYHFNCDGMEIKLVDNLDYFTVPSEEAIKTPYRLDTCY
jgi:hypothetical protein